MAELGTDQNQDTVGIDLTQFYQVFFEEAGENLEQMEQQLLVLDVTQADDEQLNSIFRCAHSIKGGAATFGFSDVAELTHQMETLLDKLRRHELLPNAGMVDVLLASGDALKAMLGRHQGSGGDAIDTQDLLASIRGYVSGELTCATVPSAAGVTAVAATPATHAKKPQTATKTGQRTVELRIGPLDAPDVADNLLDLFKEIAGLGTITILDNHPDLDNIRRFQLCTSADETELLDLFSFYVSRELVTFVAIESVADSDDSFGLFADVPEPPDERHTPAAVSAIQVEVFREPQVLEVAATAAVAIKPPAKAERAAATPSAAEASTIRVSVEKVDQLINLVGELVITQAMLAQNSRGIDPVLNQQLIAGLTDLDRNTRDLQEAVMSIRMIPMSTVFSRFPRMLRDLANKLGKKVDLITQGEATELDKGLVEKITDPLTHLVRNSCDHGIEMPEDRLRAGKSEVGNITLAASHQGGSIVIEVRDDGKGLSREKLLKKAREKGMHAPDTLTDSEVWGLIFEPGFSTAEQVTDVSGRGVGMDVVKRNITSLGGVVEIESTEGVGMRVAVRLPLTLAIMDGMSVSIGNEVYILPLSSVVESFKINPDMVKTIGGSGRVVEVREEYMPVVELGRVFNVPDFDHDKQQGIMVVVEAEYGRIALMVDQLLGQQQVVVKNLESNYRKIPDVSGATIMGDGRVALILDVSALVRHSRH